MIANGGAPYSNEICLIDDMCYTIEMLDSYGDGWNGNLMNINGVGNYTISSGSFSTANFCYIDNEIGD